MSAETQRQDGLAVVGIFLGLLALLGVILSVGLAMRAVDDAKGGTSVAAGSGPTVDVALSEFMIAPNMVSAPAGSRLKVTNKGSAPHNLTIVGTELKTPDIEAGASATLDVASLPVGEYTVI